MKEELYTALHKTPGHLVAMLPTLNKPNPGAENFYETLPNLGTNSFTLNVHNSPTHVHRDPFGHTLCQGLKVFLYHSMKMIHTGHKVVEQLALLSTCARHYVSLAS